MTSNNAFVLEDEPIPDHHAPVPDDGSRRRSQIPEDVIKGHHLERWQHQAMNVGVQIPPRGKRRHHRHRRDHHAHSAASKPSEAEPVRPPTPPSERVQYLLGQTEDDDEAHQAHELFCEMDELREIGEGGEVEWKEMARWIKFEEDVEEGGQRWSKPHVATLSLHSLFELRKGILKGIIRLDVSANNLEDIAGLIVDNMIATKQLGENDRDRVTEILMSRHHHQHDKKEGMPRIRSLADIGKRLSSKNIEVPDKKDDSNNVSNKNAANKNGSKDSMHSDGSDNKLDESASTHKFNEHFLKKIPPGAETANIMVGESDVFSQSIIVFIRLSRGLVLGELTEVPVPTRFIFLMIGPPVQYQEYFEIGRSMATLMSDEVFHVVAYKAKNREHLLAGIDEFLDQVTVLPPGEWDPTIRIEPPKSVPSQAARTAGPPGGPGGGGPGGEAPEEGSPPEEEEGHTDSTLVRTGRLFGGLINDVKRKVPFYPSDIKDAFHIQCLSSFFFVYFACLTPIVTFGGLLGSATGQNMAAIESLVAGAFCGITYHIFAGQPLTIIGSTGPILVFETIVYNFTSDQGFDYLSFRFWIGIWCSVILLIIVMFDLSALVRYITRFTEESFALLIALIYIYEAFKKLFHIIDEHPTGSYEYIRGYNESCWCQETNSTTEELDMWNITRPGWYYNLTEDDCHHYKGEMMGPGCHGHTPNPDVFYFSCILFIFTFVIAYYGKLFKDTRFLPTKIRTILSDFAVTFAIIIMVLVDYLVGIPTPKLNVPSEFAPTLPNRGWVVNPFLNPGWTIPAALGFAILCTILIFMDQQITAVIVNRKEHKLKKGSGYHLDLLVIAIQMAICSLLGLPWFVAATVLSINHVRSLTLLSETAAPGEAPKFLGIREQRVTGITVFLFVGLSVLFTTVLKLIPMPVLYGVFLYMGVASMKGIELVQRFACFFMPPKYQPDYVFLRHVPLRRVYFYTAIQVVCLAILWTIKTIKAVSIIFPLMVLAMCFVRKALEWVFTRHELKWLDDIMPESHKREKEEKKKKKEKDLHGYDNKAMIIGEANGIPPKGGHEEHMPIPSGQVTIPLKDGKTISIPVDQITYDPESKQIKISDKMSSVALWKQLTANDNNAKLNDDTGVRQRKPGKDDADADHKHKSVSFNVGKNSDDDIRMTDIVIDPMNGPVNNYRNDVTKDSNA